MNDTPDHPEPTTYEAVTARLCPLDEWQLHSVLCHIAYVDPALVAAAIERSMAA